MSKTSSETVSKTDQQHMQRVLELAAVGSKTTHPNPRVGCVLVNDGTVVGEGFHHIAGDLHAEREALNVAGESARGATAYVNLEPCCHQGRTPPCTDALINAGVTKVVAAMRDPNPLVAGGGFEQLKTAGIEVVEGVLQDQAKWLNRGFISRMKDQRPWVRVKTAATLDGRTADVNGASQWITCETARAQVQELRALSGAVLTGIGTVLADNPSLNVRLEGVERQPLRVVLDSSLRIPLDAKVIGDDDNLLVFTCSDNGDKISALTEMGVEVVQQDSDQLQLNEVFRELTDWQCNEVLVEAGQTLGGSLLQADLIDELTLFLGDSVLGDAARSVFALQQPIGFDQRSRFKLRQVSLVGESARIDSVSHQSLARLCA